MAFAICEITLGFSIHMMHYDIPTKYVEILQHSLALIERRDEEKGNKIDKEDLCGSALNTCTSTESSYVTSISENAMPL